MDTLNKKDILAAGVLAGALATSPGVNAAQSKTQTALNEIVYPANAVTFVAVKNPNENLAPVYSATMGNTQNQAKISVQDAGNYKNGLVAVNINSDNGYFIGTGSVARHDNNTRAYGASVEAGYVVGNNSPVHHISGGVSYARADEKTLSNTRTPYAHTELAGTTVSTHTFDQGNERVTQTHTDTTTKYTTGERINSIHFNGGSQRTIRGEIGLNATANGMVTIGAEKTTSNFGNGKDKNTYSMGYTQFMDKGVATANIDSDKNVSIEGRRTVTKNGASIGGKVTHNLNTHDTSVALTADIPFGSTKSSPRKPETGYEYGNYQFQNVHAGDGRYAVQNPMNYGEIVHTNTDHSTTTYRTDRTTTETRETIKQPVDLTQITENLQSVEVTLSESWKSLTIDLSDKIPEGFEIINISAEESERLRWYGAAEGAHIITPIWNNKYELIAPGPDNQYAGMGSYVYLTATVKDPNGDIHDIAINKGEEHYVAITRTK